MTSRIACAKARIPSRQLAVAGAASWTSDHSTSTTPSSTSSLPATWLYRDMRALGDEVRNGGATPCTAVRELLDQ